MDSDYEADLCEDCKCRDIESAYKCDCDCHIEIREQQDIIVKAEDEAKADELAGELCTLEIIGDSDVISTSLVEDGWSVGIKETRQEKYKSYD